jgi:hypothetical protein
MLKKPKFKPEITRIKLNPEQAVLTCSCYSTGYRGTPDMTDPAEETHFLGPKNAYASLYPVVCVISSTKYTGEGSPDYTATNASS